MNFIKKHQLSIAGIIVGYAYYRFIGCSTRNCAITSKPLNASIYGMTIGYLIFSVLEKTKLEKK